MRSIYSDLACEMLQEKPYEGIEREIFKTLNCTIEKVCICTEKAAKALGKAEGSYYTVSNRELCENNWQSAQKISTLLCRIIREILPKCDDRQTVLVLGLGNHAVTPDALGSKTVQRILVTRHIMENMPELSKGRLRSVCAIAPGVLGVTGLETGEVAQGLVEHIRPCCVICIDSLAAMSMTRVLTTVQIADTGICPGSGLNNPRRELTQRTLGVPVISIGVPLVVGMEAIADEMKKKLPSSVPWRNMVVTPKEIDEAVSNAAKVIAAGINQALQTRMTPEEIDAMIF